MLLAVTSLFIVGLGAGAPRGVERLELDHLEFEVDVDVLEHLLDGLVHRQRQHLAAAARGHHELGLEWLGSC